MASLVGTIFAFAIVFGILVFVHEFGHFFMAKLVGINVEVFSFGYGKRLFGFKRGNTDYRISLIPMGGYVKFAGEEALEGMKPSRDPQPGDFQAAKRWQRFLVIFMGPVMNIILALIFVAIINMNGVPRALWLDQPPVIGLIAPDSPAEKSQLQIGDLIVSINGNKTPTWNDVELAVGVRPDKNITVEVIRGNETLSVQLQTEILEEFSAGYAGFFAHVITQLDIIVANSPAEKAGLKAGDLVIEIDGSPVSFYQFGRIMRDNPERDLDFLIERNGERMHLTVTPRREGDEGRIGVNQSQQSVLQKYGFFEAFGASFKENIRLITLVVDFIKNLVTGEASTRQLGGPIEIANLSYTFFRAGFMAMIGWIAFISLQLGIVNLVPVPVFDGGQILVLGLEGIFRRDFSPKVKQVIIQIGFVIFIFLLVFIILNDVVKRLPNGWDSLIPF